MPPTSVSRDLHPTEGARFLLERLDVLEPGGARATYRASIYTPDAEFSSTATLGEDGTAEVPPTGAPAELDEMLGMLAKLTARGAAKRRADELVVWPARLLRWRGPGRGPVR
jgi:hypothetical protein